MHTWYKKIKNIIRWIPILWKDRDWDYYYTFEILKTKLKFQSEYTRKHGCHENSIREAQRMELCIRLIDKVQNEYYLDEYIMKKDFASDEDINDAIIKQDKAKRILFKILEQNIERWWD